MTMPAILLGFTIAAFLGSFYHLIRGGSFWRLLLYIGLSVLGFAAGHILGQWRGWTFLPVGSLNLGFSIGGSIVILIAGDWLSRIESDRESTV